MANTPIPPGGRPAILYVHGGTPRAGGGALADQEARCRAKADALGVVVAGLVVDEDPWGNDPARAGIGRLVEMIRVAGDGSLVVAECPERLSRSVAVRRRILQTIATAGASAVFVSW